MNQSNNIDTTTKDSFAQQLQRLWSIESQLVEAMPRMIQKAGILGLKKNLAMHFEETRQQMVAIEAICKQLDVDSKAGEPDSGLQRLLQEGEQKMINASGSGVDAVIVAGAQKIEVHEIQAYLPAIDAARALGYKGIAQRLALSLEEERQAETKLAFLDKELVSPRATAATV